jgi:hypothetical protein
VLIDREVRVIDVQELSGLFGDRREDLRRRGLAGDQRRRPAQRRLLLRQHAPGLLRPGRAADGQGRERADGDRHHQEQAEDEHGARAQRKPVGMKSSLPPQAAVCNGAAGYQLPAPSMMSA